jgi:hypothetical protein
LFSTHAGSETLVRRFDTWLAGWHTGAQIRADGSSGDAAAANHFRASPENMTAAQLQA